MKSSRASCRRSPDLVSDDEVFGGGEGMDQEAPRAAPPPAPKVSASHVRGRVMGREGPVGLGASVCSLRLMYARHSFQQVGNVRKKKQTGNPIFCCP